MKFAALFLVCFFALLAPEATASILDFWVRVSSVKQDLGDRRLISLDLRFRNGVTIGIADLPFGWEAAVQKDKEGVFLVQLVSSQKPADPARLSSLLACVTICPDEVDDRDLKVEFLGGEAIVPGRRGDIFDAVSLKIAMGDLLLKQEVKAVGESAVKRRCAKGRTRR
jgi:hypothetical protein